MNTLLITYNLNNHDDDYQKLFTAIEALGETWHDGTKLDSVWFVKTTAAPKAARDRLRTALDRDDNCVIVDITGASHAGWMPKEFWTWFNA